MKALGCAPTQESSGEVKRRHVTSGSELCRRALWQWVFTRIEPKRNRKFSPIGEQLGAIMDAEKTAGRPTQLVRARTCAKAARMLFYALATNLNGDS